MAKRIAAQNPSRGYLNEICEVARLLTWHIRTYWSVNRKPLSAATVGIMGDSIAMRRAAKMLKAVESQRRGKYPGPVIEWQLRELVFRWQELNAGEIAFAPNVFLAGPTPTDFHNQYSEPSSEHEARTE